VELDLVIPPLAAVAHAPVGGAPEAEPAWQSLVARIRAEHGLELEQYKQASLQRRVGKRMSAVGTGSFAAYERYLAAHPHELPALLHAIFINVTSFFRDPAAWHALSTVLTDRLSADATGRSLRVWSAGCASGEEAYSLAMLFADLLGLEQAQARITIFATDVHEPALTMARRGVYSERAAAGIPAERLETYFERGRGVFRVRKALRQLVIFGRHDLTVQSPIGRIDLLVCRNTLMYLTTRAQERILTRFRFALNAGSLLFLGRAETAASSMAGFAPLDLDGRLLVRLPRR